MTKKSIHLGFEIGTGEPVAVPLRHMAVTGQTQQSGKTTTLEALITRAGGTALTFVTKRGEGSFATGRRVQPYFRDRADWQFVDALLEAILAEKNKMLRAPIIKICRNTKTLADVQREVKRELRTARGFYEGAFTQLDAYLDLIVPEIESAELAVSLDLQPGINVMDVSAFRTPMQMLFIQSALDWVNEHATHTTVVIPEAWEFVPEGKGSPVKSSAVTLVRKGAAERIQNFIWLDSQDMAGVDKTILRGCTVWLIGVQREANEIKRNLQNIPAGMKRPKPEEIASLEIGQFFACFGKTTVKVYVQPEWMAEAEAKSIALGAASIDDVIVPTRAPAPPPIAAPKPAPAKEDEVDQATANALIEENARLKAEIHAAEKRGYERGITDITNYMVGAAREFVEAPLSGTIPIRTTEPSPTPVPTKPPRERAPAGPASASDNNPAGLKLLASLARFSAPIAWNDAALACGMAPGNGYFYGGKKWLTETGLAIDVEGGAKATAAGLKRAGGAGSPPTRREIVALWAAKLKAPGSQILEFLAKSPTKSFSADEIAAASGLKPGNGYWYGGVAAARDPGLIVQDGKSFRLGDFLRASKA